MPWRWPAGRAVVLALASGPRIVHDAGLRAAQLSLCWPPGRATFACRIMALASGSRSSRMALAYGLRERQAIWLLLQDAGLWAASLCCHCFINGSWSALAFGPLIAFISWTPHTYIYILVAPGYYMYIYIYKYIDQVRLRSYEM